MTKNIEILTNRKEKIITSIRKELESCDEFIISAAFITSGGITMLLEQLKELQKKGVKGKILTGDYLNFTEPTALKKLMEFKNIEVKIAKGEKHHAKGFLFRRGETWKIIIGSSNLTQSAMTSNLEWNLALKTHGEEKIVQDVLEEFHALYDALEVLTHDEVATYEKIYQEYRRTLEQIELLSKKDINSKEIQPNFMQREALINLAELRKKKKDRALLISATGTGKTYLSAMDVRQYHPKRFLFVAHRKNILSRSQESFEKVLRGYEIEGHFAMVQTLNKKENLEKFSKDHFDYIIVDEVHHSGAKTYQNIISYFEPKFFLGMTATPERTDSFDIYALFDYNIAYEIRLHDALRENLLCPFHYFGISDIAIDGKILEEKVSIKELASSKRMDHILEKASFYGYSGEKLHGLIFVSSVEEAKLISQGLNERGMKTRDLSSMDSEEERERAIEALENGELEYLITVDIFNEGIDIPCLNQIILLRPTQSAIVYIQQLGRGLRKHSDKEYVVILDFIGNYEKNFLIPTALSQNNSYDKDFLKKFLELGTEYLPGESTIIFEEIVKERIFENINRSNFSTRKNIEHDYNLLKKQLGRVPYLYDFFSHNMIDPSVILKFKKEYDEVLNILEKSEIQGSLSPLEKGYLQFLSQFFTPAKRVHEMEILTYILKHGKGELERLTRHIEKLTGHKNQRGNVRNALQHLAKEIFTSLSTMKLFPEILIQSSDSTYTVAENFKHSFNENSYFKKLVEDLIEYNLEYSKKNYPQNSSVTMLKDRAYSKQEAFWYLNLDYNNGYQVGGYTIFDNPPKVMLFITIEDDTYENSFLDDSTFYWFSKPRRVLMRDGKPTKEGLIAENYYDMTVFAKKKDGENFYYLGSVQEVLSAEEIKNEKGDSLVKYLLKIVV